MIVKRTFIALLLAVLIISSGVVAQELAERKAADEMSIAEIMGETNKKPIQLLKKVQKGEANDAEKARLVDLYKSMAKQEPPKGNLDDWKKRMDLLVDAAEKGQKGEPGADKLLRKAANCMACHKDHKGES